MMSIATVATALLSAVTIGAVSAARGKSTFEKDTFRTESGDLEITFIGHGSLMMERDGKIIYVDPVGEEADYSTFPKADLVLVTHDHDDHFDPTELSKIRTDATTVIVTEKCAERVTGGRTMKNGDVHTWFDTRIEAVPAYNVAHKRPNGRPFHPKGEGNGYVITLGGVRVYIAGDTENIPEMNTLENIDIAFLPMNLPYTMTPEMVAEAARSFGPKILYPYHYGDTNAGRLSSLLEGEGRESIEVRIRRMK